MGRCVAVEGKVSYEPFVDVLKAWAGVADASDARRHKASFDAMVTELVGEDAAADVFPFVARMLGWDQGRAGTSPASGIEGVALERRIHEAVRTLFAAKAARHPLVVTLEDLHWADQSTIRLLEALLPLVETHPVLIVASFRPGNDSTYGRIVAFADRAFRLRHHRIELRPLLRRQAVQLARELLGHEELPEQVIRLVDRKGEGNPFFIEEIARTLVQSGAVVEEAGRLRVNERLASIASYGSVGELVMSRVSRLTPQARRVLETASVMGRQVYRRVLEAMLGEGADVDEVVRELQAERFLRPMSTRQTPVLKVRRLSAESGFVFEHALTQETVLASLAGADRRRLHRICAEAVESVYKHRLQDFYGLLAYQYTGARCLEKANEYLCKAGEAAAASAEALYFFREGYRTYKILHGSSGDKETEARLERDIALALLNVGNLSECIEHFNAAIRLYGEPVPRSAWSMRLKFLRDLPAVLAGLYLGSFGTDKSSCSERDNALFELMYNRCRAQNIADDSRRTFDTVAAIRHVGHLDPSSVENSTGILAAAGAFFAFSGISFGPSRRFLAIAEKLSRQGGRSDRFLYRTMAFVVRFFEGDWSSRHDIAEEDFEYGLRHGFLWDADVYLGMNCERNIHQGEYEKAELQIEACGELCERWGYDFARSNQLGTRAHLLVAQRRLEEAREAAIRWHEVRNEDQIHLLALSLLAKIECLDHNLGAAADALARAEHIRSHARGLHFPFYSGAYLTSRLLFRLQELEESHRSQRTVPVRLVRRVRRDCRRALASARKIARDRTETFRLAARLYWLLGSRTRAFRLWEQALDIGGQLGEKAELARCYRDLWRSLASVKTNPVTFRGRDASAWLERAIDAFVQLGAERELEEIDKFKVEVRAA